MRKSSTRRQCVTFLVVALVWLTHSEVLVAQFRAVGPLPSFIQKESVNLFFRLEDSLVADGFLLDIPPDWDVMEVRIVHPGKATERVSLRRKTDTETGWVGFPDSALSDEDQVVLTIRPDGWSARSEISLTAVRRTFSASGMAYVSDGSGASRFPAQVHPAPSFTGNLSADFREDREYPILPAHRLPDLSFGSSHTVEFWFRTTELDRVVLSTWTGNDTDPYPFEFVIDPQGYMRVFQGLGAGHVSVRSGEPMADGAWHHAALVYEAASRWTRFFINGIREDSLLLAMALPTGGDPDVGVGGRIGPGVSDTGVAYTGQLDELRIWASSRPASAIRRDMRNPSPPMGSRDFREAFNRTGGDPALARVARSPSTLAFQRPLEDVGVEMNAGGVRLSWRAPDRNVTAFVIERSGDGTRFEEIERIPVEKRSDDLRSFDFVDIDVRDGVHYYRIRQIRAGGLEDLSRTMKVGMGVENASRSAFLTGNFPNPFNPTTNVTFTVEESQQIHLSVWDLSGQLVTVLIDGSFPVGEHEVTFTARDLPSGTYFVRLRSNAGTETRQIVLMK